MTVSTEDFLRFILPPTGTYALAWRTRPTAKGFTHETFTDIAVMAEHALAQSRLRDVFNTLHSFNPTGEDGKFSRKGRFALECRVFYADLDVGTPDPDKPPRYLTKTLAMEGLERFLAETGWPSPTMTSSGGGIHIYWRLVETISSREWKEIAEKLKRVFAALGLLTDTGVTADAARVLRAAGTANWKLAPRLRPVVMLTDFQEPIPVATFKAMIAEQLAKLPDEEVVALTKLPEGEAPSIKDVAQVCPSFNVMLEVAHKAEEPLWYATAQLVRHLKNGVALVHKVSALHPDYSQASTQAKVVQLETQGIGPTTCGKIEGVLGQRNRCASCANWGLPKSSPIVFARRKPTVELPVDLPPPGEPYRITSRGVEYRPPVAEDEPPKPAQVISPYVIVPWSLIDAPEIDNRMTVWMCHIPLRGKVEVEIPADVMGDPGKMSAKFAQSGVFLDGVHAKRFSAYMSHYIRQLQALRPEQEQFRTFGWTDEEGKRFILPSGEITKAGVRPVHISPTVRNAAASLITGGDMQSQIRALRFYGDPAYVRQQFMICLALAAPLLYKLRYHGLLANIYGASGASKSSALFAGGGQWGHPLRYVLNGTDKGFTAKARLVRMATLSSLPVIFDDTTDVSGDDMKSMIMALTQAGGTGALRADRTEKLMPDALKSSVMLSSSNNSMHGLLSQNNIAGDAGSLRTIELEAQRLFIHSMAQADAFKEELLEHYGHTGPAFIRYVLENETAIMRMLTQIKENLIKRARMQQQERYWFAGFTLGLLGAAVGQHMGLLDYDPKNMENWIVDYQMPQMRAVLLDNYASPLGVLQSYLAEIANDMLVVIPLVGSTNVHPDRQPRGALRARFEPHNNAIWIKADGFKNYCDTKAKANYATVVRMLTNDAVIFRERIDLARHVEGYVVGQSTTFRINTAHPQMAGSPPVADSTGAVVVKFPGAAAK